MRIAINGNRHQEGHFENIDRLIGKLIARGDDVVMSSRFLDYLTEHLGPRFPLGITSVPMTETPRGASLAISIGGDGAFLKTARWLDGTETPIAGINTGHLGFLSAFNFDKPEEIESGLVNGHYEIEKRSVLRAETSDGCVYDALNEVAVTRGENASMITCSVHINGNNSLNYIGDGLIFATPTGSTAYNLSVGGPILDPALPGWVISPIACHSLSIRPMVVNDTSVITVDIDLRAKNYRLLVDGRTVILPRETSLRLTKAPTAVNVVVQPRHSFTDTLRTKLGLGNLNY